MSKYLAFKNNTTNFFRYGAFALSMTMFAISTSKEEDQALKKAMKNEADGQDVPSYEVLHERFIQLGVAHLLTRQEDEWQNKMSLQLSTALANALSLFISVEERIRIVTTVNACRKKGASDERLHVLLN
jgi:hypothetical protein